MAGRFAGRMLKAKECWMTEELGAVVESGGALDLDVLGLDFDPASLPDVLLALSGFALLA